MRRIATRRQRTLGQAAAVSGIGFVTGAEIQLRFLPAAEDTGVVFRRVDLPGRPEIPAHVSLVTGTQRRTTLGHGNEQVSLVEHVMASLAGLRIDNCIVEIDAPEPPGMDGSAAPFVEALLGAGIQPQHSIRNICTVTAPCGINTGHSSIALHPGDKPGLRVSYFLDYGLDAPLPRQLATVDVDPASFERDVAPSRTFILESEAAHLRAQGLGSRTTPKDLIIFGQSGPIDNALRFADEPARHKILDIIGDLALLGIELAGHVVACRSGHPLNVALGQDLWMRAGQAGGYSFRARTQPVEPVLRRAA